MMRKQTPQGGRIINNGSVSAHAPRPSSAPYTATKHAITGLTKTLALDGRPFNIACGQIDIGNALPNGRADDDQACRRPTAPSRRGDDGRRARRSSVLYMASLPLDANVLFMTTMATNMPFVGRG